jgi:tetratricopeptide (TPR) repeat protein
LDQAVELAPTNTDYLYERGLLRYELAEYPAAIEDLSEAIALKWGYAYIDPQHVKPYIARGTAQLRAGRLGQASADANSALHLLSGNLGAPEWDNRRKEINLLFAGGHELLADVYTASGQLENAEAEYQLAYAYIDPQHVKPYIVHGTAQLRAGRLGQALDDANSALHLLSGNFGAPEWDNRRQEINLLIASGHDLLGDVYAASGQPENAEAEYQLASGLK